MGANKTTQHPVFDLNQTTTKINLADVFGEGKDYLNEFSLFIAHFNSIPNHISEGRINCEKARAWFVSNYQSEIKDMYFNKRFYASLRNTKIADIFYFLYDDLIIYFLKRIFNMYGFYIVKQNLQKWKKS